MTQNFIRRIEKQVDFLNKSLNNLWQGFFLFGGAAIQYLQNSLFIYLRLSIITKRMLIIVILKCIHFTYTKTYVIHYNN